MRTVDPEWVALLLPVSQLVEVLLPVRLLDEGLQRDPGLPPIVAPATSHPHPGSSPPRPTPSPAPRVGPPVTYSDPSHPFILSHPLHPLRPLPPLPPLGDTPR